MNLKNWTVGTLFAGALVLVTAVGCSTSDKATPAIPTVPASPSPTPTALVELAGTRVSGPEAEALAFRVLVPDGERELQAGAVRIMGETSEDAVVFVNAVPAQVGPDGVFYADVVLDSGLNYVELVASRLDGQSVSTDMSIVVIPPEGDTPLDLLYPPEGLETSSNSVQVFGAAAVDATVAINGDVVALSELGLFSKHLSLAAGPNLIEITAADMSGAVHTEQVVVYYIPESEG